MNWKTEVLCVCTDRNSYVKCCLFFVNTTWQLTWTYSLIKFQQNNVFNVFHVFHKNLIYKTISLTSRKSFFV
jgi:hypothetical protein